MSGIDERLVLALALSALGVVLATVNVAYALDSYREFRDGRGLRGLVAAFTMAFMTVGLIVRSPTIREWLAAWDTALMVVSSLAVSAALIGLGFSVYTWRSSRHRRGE